MIQCSTFMLSMVITLFIIIYTACILWSYKFYYLNWYLVRVYLGLEKSQSPSQLTTTSTVSTTSKWYSICRYCMNILYTKNPKSHHDYTIVVMFYVTWDDRWQCEHTVRNNICVILFTVRKGDYPIWTEL